MKHVGRDVQAVLPEVRRTGPVQRFERLAHLERIADGTAQDGSVAGLIRGLAGRRLPLLST